jgi:hypothetical protein
MRDVVSVLTCPFWHTPNPVNVPAQLMATLTQLDLAGADRAQDKVVFCDGPFPFDEIRTSTSPRTWRVIDRSGPSGSVSAFWWVFAHALKLNCDRLLFFEDDVFVCKGTVKRMQAIGVPDSAAMIRYYDSVEWPPGTPPGLYRSPGIGRHPLGLIGMQGVVIPKDTLNLLNFSSAGCPTSSRPADIVLSELLHAHGRHVLTHIPSLVQHEGVISRSGAGPHQASNFAGYNYDAS